MKYRYIASCVFTRDYPELSLRIQDYLKQRFGMDIIRCCADKYKVKQFEDVMAPSVCERWKATPHFIPFDPDTTMISICHNCTEGLRLAGQPHYHIAELLFPYSV